MVQYKKCETSGVLSRYLLRPGTKPGKRSTYQRCADSGVEGLSIE